MTSLKPCPVCDNELKVKKDTRVWTVYCETCGAQKTFRNVLPEDAMIAFSNRWLRDSKTVSKWLTRKIQNDLR